MDSFTTEAFTLLGIGLFVIGIRTYARVTTVGVAHFKADDYLMFVAAVAYSAETALAYSVGAYWQGLANNAMTDEERKALDPTSHEYYLRVNGSKTQVAGWSTYTFLLWTLKAAMCTFYMRLTDGLDYRVRIYIGFVMIFTTWVAVLLSILLGCRPMSKNWQIYPDPGNFCQPAISRIDIFVTVVLNVLTDLYLMSIPLPMLWKANLKPVRKVGLMVMFSGGIFVTMAGILRCVLIISNPVTGAQQAGSWAVRETFVAVITSNLPMVVPLLRRWGGPVFDSMLSSYRRRTTNSGHGTATTSGRRSGRSGRSNLFALTDKNPRRGMGPRSVNPIPNMTFSESEEAIYLAELQKQQQTQTQAPGEAPLQPDSQAIIKEVELVITEEELHSHSSSDRRSRDCMRDVEGAHQGNYFLTRQQGSSGSGNSGGLGSRTTPSATAAASPLSSAGWNGGHAPERGLAGRSSLGKR